jgi:hypothetical protein
MEEMQIGRQRTGTYIRYDEDLPMLAFSPQNGQLALLES